MKFIKPITINDAIVTDSNVPESDEIEWTSAGAPYAANAVRMVTTTANGASEATHMIYRSTAGSNNEDPTERTTYVSGDTTVFWWEEVSPTNRFKMFDSVVQEQTELAGGIVVELTPGEWTNSLALINVDGSDVDIVMTSTADGEVYNENFSLTSYSGIQDWYAYYFTPIERMTELVITELPVYLDATIEVSINSSGTAKCGSLVLGMFFDIGLSLNGAQFGIIDYSVKSTDAEGRVTITERAYAKKAQVDVLVETARMSQVGIALTDILNVPVVWTANENDSNTVIYGYYKEFQTVYSDYRSSMCALQIEGLT